MISSAHAHEFLFLYKFSTFFLLFYSATDFRLKANKVKKFLNKMKEKEDVSKLLSKLTLKNNLDQVKFYKIETE